MVDVTHIGRLRWVEFSSSELAYVKIKRMRSDVLCRRPHFRVIFWYATLLDRWVWSSPTGIGDVHRRWHGGNALSGDD